VKGEIKMFDKFKTVGEKYGFQVIEKGNEIILTAINTDGKQVNWIKYNKNTDTVSYIGNTDNCNIWFCDTRKDLTPEQIIEFVNDLNVIFELVDEEKFKVRDLIDPEDWQEIVNINDAYTDERYI
jgi:hypothetical protein